MVVPGIGVDQELIELGLNPDGTMEVPDTGLEVGWFSPGSRIGETGPTVVAAHVDDRVGIGAFSRLVEVAEGDEVVLYGADGDPVTYQVTRTVDHAKARFPTAEVFGATSSDEVRLITCTGAWDPVAQSYEENRIVFATRVATD